jgi:polyhydroxyalkanoate synthesis regulator protein
VQIIDLKSGDDLTRQYLLQIIADHEGRGENVLPINVLTDLVRSYTTEVQSVVPQFLAMSFDMLRDGQSKVMEKLSNPLAQMPGFDAMQAQQQAFMKAMTGGIAGVWTNPETGTASTTDDAPSQPPAGAKNDASDLEDIKKQLAELQSKLSRLG